MTTNAEIIPEVSSTLDDLKHKLLLVSADPAVQDALAQLSAAVDDAEEDIASQTSTAARLVSSVQACFIPGMGPSEHYGTARAELFAHATDVRKADAIPGIYPYPATLLTFADDSRAFVPNSNSRGECLPYILAKHIIFLSDDLVGDRIPRVYASKADLIRDTKPIVLKYELQSRSEGTKRTYSSQWKQWVGFATEHDMKILPADPSDFAQWLTARADEGRSFSTISLGLQVVKAIHLYYDQPHPCNDLVLKTFSGIRRRLGVAQTQVSGLTPEAITAIETTACTPRRTRGGKIERVASARKRGHVDIAISRTSFDGMLRIGELSALFWRDFSVDPKDRSGLLYIGSSKTDRASEGVDVYISAETAASLERIRGAAGQNEKVFPLSGRQLRRRIASAAAAAGLEGRFSGHSGRVGMAQTLAAEDFGQPAIQTAGRWKAKQMPAVYTRFQTPRQGAVARLDRLSMEATK